MTRTDNDGIVFGIHRMMMARSVGISVFTKDAEIFAIPGGRDAFAR
jgi:hypothetical protein